MCVSFLKYNHIFVENRDFFLPRLHLTPLVRNSLRRNFSTVLKQELSYRKQIARQLHKH